MTELRATAKLNFNYPQDQHISSLAQRIQNIQWYSANAPRSTTLVESLIGEFGQAMKLPEFAVHWLSSNELQSVCIQINLAQSPLWDRLFPIPHHLRRDAETLGLTDQLQFISNEMLEKIFHSAYDGAFTAFEANGDLTVKYAVGTALYISGLALGWELLANAGTLGPNPFIHLIAIFESGHWPLGLYNGEFYVR